MVLEALIDDESIIRHPVFMFIESFIVSSIALWTAFYVFPSSASILSIAFITIALIPLTYSVLIKEETLESIKKGNPFTFIGRHFELIKIFAYFFIGITVSYAFWYTILPETNAMACISGFCFEIPQHRIFAEQKATLGDIEKLRASITGNIIISGKNCTNFSCIFNLIFFNNAQVMAFAILLSLVYGAGALMLLGWNASVIGTLIGQSILAENHLRFLGLLPHGIPEVLAYFLAAISGWLLSITVTKKHLVKHEVRTVFFDALAIFFFALISLASGAIIEALLIVKDEGMALSVSMLFLIGFSMLVFFGMKTNSEAVDNL